jgi:hypothetical protein
VEIAGRNGDGGQVAEKRKSFSCAINSSEVTTREKCRANFPGRIASHIGGGAEAWVTWKVCSAFFRKMRMNQILDLIAFPKSDAQEEAANLLIVAGINVAFLLVAGLVLWLTGYGALAWQFTKGYGLLWLLLFVLSPILNLIQRAFRLNMYDNGNVFVASNLLVSGVLVLGWSAFAALAVQGAGAAGWVVGLLYVIGFLASYIAEQVVTVIFNGTIYQMANLALALVSFIVFSIWPAGAHFLFGWFLD